MLAMIDAAAEMIKDRDFTAYQSDVPLRLAVERCVEIESQASRHVPESGKSRFSEVPRQESAAIGNKLRHEYNHIDDRILWRVATTALPALRPVIVTLLEDT